MKRMLLTVFFFVSPVLLAQQLPAKRHEANPKAVSVQANALK
jgi:hypothetical protein